MAEQPTQTQAVRAAMAALPPTRDAVDLAGFSFGFGGAAGDVLIDIDLSVPRGARALLVGANGAGKSTLLRVLAGRSMAKTGTVRVLGKHPFFESPEGVTYLGTEWAMNPVVRRDVPVSRLLKTLGAERYPDRCAQLLDIMDVDVDWHMHEVSDGQRRRVQIVLGLMQPWDLLLLDEVTVDLDVIVRADLLRFLRDETESRGATVLYATHIFDGLAGWPTHAVHIAEGRVLKVRAANEPGGFPELDTARAARAAARSVAAAASSDPAAAADAVAVIDNSPLLAVVDAWLREDLRNRKRHAARKAPDGRPMTRWEMLSENMKE
ncbi:CCR4-NOT regulatory complex component, partial [Cladochytrium tenue]